jgi:predicted transcriptional regulator
LEGEQARELGELLGQLGLDARQAQVIAFLAEHGEGRSAEIERTCGLRQPQVSQATTTLEERGWIHTRTEKTPGKGRPVNVYSLASGLGEIVELASDGEGPAVPRDTTRAGASTGMIPQDPSGPTCPTTAMMHTEEGTQTLAPPAGATFSDAFAITEDGYAAGVAGTGEARQAAMWAPDGDRAHLGEAIDLREGRSLVAAQAIVDDHLVALVEDDDAGVRPLALGLDRVRTLADTGDPAPLIGDEEETPRFEMEAGSASPGGRITLTLTFVNDDTLADRVEVDLPFEAPVTNEGWEIAATEEPENVEGDFSEATLEAWAESVPAGATVEASATFQVPEDAASTSYEYQALSTTVDGEEIQPTPTATFTVRG